MKTTIPLIVVVGPTASGKTGLAIALAKQFNGEIISADSRQVYRRLDIGTAKVTPEEMSGVPHHLIDIVDIQTVYTAHNFVQDATAAIADIHSRGHVPIVAGGTFFYIDSLLGTTRTAPVAPQREMRALLETLPLSALVEKLAIIDPKRLATIDQKNPRRLIRAIEIAEAGVVATEVMSQPPPYQTYFVGLTLPKEELRARYRARAETWLKNGFLTEVDTLLKSGVSRTRLSEIGFEYVLGLELLDDHLTEAMFIQKFIEKNWQYAKRQMTWLRRNPDIYWVNPNDFAAVKLSVSDFLST